MSFGGFGDWRLPTTDACLHNCTGGELSDLFVTELGYNVNGSGLDPNDDTAEQIANRALFSNLQSIN